MGDQGAESGAVQTTKSVFMIVLMILIWVVFAGLLYYVYKNSKGAIETMTNLFLMSVLSFIVVMFFRTTKGTVADTSS